MNKVLELIKIADIHADRISFAVDKLQNIFPISAEKVTNLSEQELDSLSYSRQDLQNCRILLELTTSMLF